MLYLFLAIFLYTAASLLIAAASRRANPSFVALIMQFFTLVIPLLIIVPALAKKSLAIERPVVLMTILAGLAIGLFAVVVNKSYAVNKVGVVVPVVYGGTILLTAIVGYFLFKETLKPFELLGLVLVLAGISSIIYARAIA